MPNLIADIIIGCIAMDNLESRVTDLEIQITYQNKTLEELNTIIIDQQKKINTHEKFNSYIIETLRDFIEIDDDLIPGGPSRNTRPHY
mgnify:FL=1|tara:strand:+ start:267 stop:530 length:264 start_codon:yes stop_codon:yes gene_type:complete